jgi:hypothetical protein
MEQTASTGKDDCDDLLVCGFWAMGTDCMLLDARVTDTDTDTDATKSCSKRRDPVKVPEPQSKGGETKVFGGMP